MTREEAFYSNIDNIFEECVIYLTDESESIPFCCQTCPHKKERETLDCWKAKLASRCEELRKLFSKDDKKARKKARKLI